MWVISFNTTSPLSRSKKSRAARMSSFWTKAIKGENRWKLFGKTASGRYLVVVFTIRRKLFRAVTAYEMNATDWRNYAPQID
jgi:uncharacterized DUF497 family protein